MLLVSPPSLSVLLLCLLAEVFIAAPAAPAAAADRFSLALVAELIIAAPPAD